MAPGCTGASPRGGTARAGQRGAAATALKIRHGKGQKAASEQQRGVLRWLHCKLHPQSIGMLCGMGFLRSLHTKKKKKYQEEKCQSDTKKSWLSST